MRPAVALQETTSAALADVFEGRLVLRMPDGLAMSADDFYDFCQLNQHLRFERTAQGEVIVMPPGTGGETGNRNFSLNGQFYLWTKQDGSGVFFDSSTTFNLPNTAERSPDAAWVRKARLAQLTAAQKRKFMPLCPDFAVELLSPSDRLEVVQAKMEEYLDNGLRLGWLIDADHRTVYVYRPGSPVEELINVMEVSGDPELPGFVLQLAEIWEPDLG
jgi:Uma2 family endonuclease